MVDATALQPLADSDTPTLALVGAPTPAHSGAEQLAHSGFGSAVESVAPEPAESGAGSVGSFIAPSSTTGSATLMPASGGALPTLAHCGASSLSPGSAGTLDSWGVVGDGPDTAVDAMATVEQVRAVGIVSASSLPLASALAHATAEEQSHGSLSQTTLVLAGVESPSTDGKEDEPMRAAATLPSTGGAHPLQLATGGVPTDALDNSSDAGASWFAEVTAGDAAGVPKNKQRTSVGQDAAAATAEIQRDL